MSNSSLPDPRTLSRTRRDPQATSRSVPLVMDAEEAQRRYEDAVGDQAQDIETIADARAHAQVAWEQHRDRVYLWLKATGEWKNEALARAVAKATPSETGILGEELYAASLITEAAEQSSRDHLRALQSQLSSAQTRVNTLLKVTGLY